ncbi:hypothetical protein OC835_007126 [Tilletia horrida]|nr:hypothetical protein OC835_007126 [Tilletia horrida]
MAPSNRKQARRADRTTSRVMLDSGSVWSLTQGGSSYWQHTEHVGASDSILRMTQNGTTSFVPALESEDEDPLTVPSSGRAVPATSGVGAASSHLDGPRSAPSSPPPSSSPQPAPTPLRIPRADTEPLFSSPVAAAAVLSVPPPLPVLTIPARAPLVPALCLPGAGALPPTTYTATSNMSSSSLDQSALDLDPVANAVAIFRAERGAAPASASASLPSRSSSGLPLPAASTPAAAPSSSDASAPSSPSLPQPTAAARSTRARSRPGIEAAGRQAISRAKAAVQDKLANKTKSATTARASGSASMRAGRGLTSGSKRTGSMSGSTLSGSTSAGTLPSASKRTRPSSAAASAPTAISTRGSKRAASSSASTSPAGGGVKAAVALSSHALNTPDALEGLKKDDMYSNQARLATQNRLSGAMKNWYLQTLIIYDPHKPRQTSQGTLALQAL